MLFSTILTGTHGMLPSMVVTSPQLRLLTAVTLIIPCIIPETSAADMHWDYIVIGAGPAGLQMGYFLERAGRDYMVLEQANASGKIIQ